jgi:hypothetical protein
VFKNLSKSDLNPATGSTPTNSLRIFERGILYNGGARARRQEDLILITFDNMNLQLIIK